MPKNLRKDDDDLDLIDLHDDKIIMIIMNPKKLTVSMILIMVSIKKNQSRISRLVITIQRGQKIII